jgi:hypothetical protein
MGKKLVASPARIFSMNTHALDPGLPRRLASAHRYGSLLAKTDTEATVMYKKAGSLVRRCEPGTTFYVQARKKWCWVWQSRVLQYSRRKTR